MAETLKKAPEERQRLINDTVLWETPAGEVVSIYEGSFIASMKELDREKFQWKRNWGRIYQLRKGECIKND